LTTRRTALVVVVPEAEPLVADYRRRFDTAAVARSIPPHVTIVFPFAPVERARTDILASLEDLYAKAPSFDFALVRVDRFEKHVWLAPDPPGRFVELTELTAARFPRWPPYEGVYGEVIPHLTVGSGENIGEMASAARDELGSALPVSARANAVSLLEEQADGTWTEGAMFRLGAR
jgi:2'-5' RNA ligase